MNGLSGFVTFIGFRYVGPGGRVEPISDFGLYFSSFLVKLILLANIDYLVLLWLDSGHLEADSRGKGISEQDSCVVKVSYSIKSGFKGMKPRELV